MNVSDNAKSLAQQTANYLIKALLGVVSFLLVLGCRQCVQTLVAIQRDILSLKIELAQIRSGMLTEDRVRQLIHLENSNN